MSSLIWIGEVPATCDLCREPIKSEFVDGRTKFGPWANMCPSCFSFNGVGLGLGKGQKFVKREDNKFVKVEG